MFIFFSFISYFGAEMDGVNFLYVVEIILKYFVELVIKITVALLICYTFILSHTKYSYPTCLFACFILSFGETNIENFQTFLIIKIFPLFLIFIFF